MFKTLSLIILTSIAFSAVDAAQAGSTGNASNNPAVIQQPVPLMYPMKAAEGLGSTGNESNNPAVIQRRLMPTTSSGHAGGYGSTGNLNNDPSVIQD